MSAPKGESNGAPDEQEAVERVQALPVDPNDEDTPSIEDSDRELQSVIYTDGETEYAHIYLAATTGTYRGNDMLWLRYVWLSKPGAYESDMWGENGISIRMVLGMESTLPAMVAAACNGLKNGGRGDSPVVYKDVNDET